MSDVHGATGHKIQVVSDVDSKAHKYQIGVDLASDFATQSADMRLIALEPFFG